MKKSFVLVPVLLAVTVFSFLSFTAKKNHSTILFQATYSTTSERLEPPPMLKIKITGLGTSNELNITKFVAISTQDRTTAPPFKMAGTCSWYAKDGDSFTTSFTGTVTPGPDSTMVVAMTGPITGGTGKFVHAKGAIEGRTIVDPKKTSATIDCKGTITW